MDVDFKEYPTIGLYGSYFIHTFRLSIGDVSPPIIEFWRNSPNLGLAELYSKIIIIIIWYVWAAHQVLIVLVLLNFMIAIIINSYDKVNSNQQFSKYVHYCELNRQISLIKKTLGMLKKSESIYILTARKDALTKEFQQW